MQGSKPCSSLEKFRYADPFDALSLDRAGALETVVAVQEWATRVIRAKEQENQDTPSHRSPHPKKNC